MSQNLINGRYEKERLLGEGTFGTIYLVKNIETDEKAAIKVFKDFNQFIEEKKIWEMTGEISGVVKILESFEENETGFLVMEYLPGGTLKNYLEKNKKVKQGESFEKAELLRPVMEALHQLHSKGIVHCDISPDNIMFGDDGKVKLIDFGAAKVLSEGGKECESTSDFKERILKEQYAAPEQYANPEKQGPWTDVYEICAVLYEMISGEKVPSVTKRMNSDELEDLYFYVKNEGKVEHAIMRGLQLEIQKRYFSMALFMEACDQDVELYKYLDSSIRHKWGKLWIHISSQGKFTGLVNDSGNKKRVFRKKVKIAGGIVGFVLIMIAGSWYYHTHFQEEKFSRKLKAAMNSVYQINDTKTLSELDEDFEEKLQYLKEYGNVTDEQEESAYYSLEETEYLKWGVKSNKCRKMYLDYETLKDACFYYLDLDDRKINSNEKKFSSSIYWNKSGIQSLDVVGKKTETWDWGDSLIIEYDAADQRVFSLSLTTADIDQMRVFLNKILRLCCPETYLEDAEIEEIIEKIKNGDEDVAVVCLNEKAWLWGYGYELSDEFYYQCEITASKGTMWN